MVQSGSSASGVGPTLLSIIGGALVSAGLISMVLGWLSKSEITTEISASVSEAMEDVLDPVREIIYQDVIQSYRWDCYLGPPPPHDPLPDHAYQWLRLSYRLSDIPGEFRAVCMASESDAVIKHFSEDDRYVFRWLVDEGLDPSAPYVCVMGDLRLDGQVLKRSKPNISEIDGVRYCEYRWRTTKADRQRDAVLELRAGVRKWVGKDERLLVRTTVFKTVTDAEFRLMVDDQLDVEKIGVSTSQVTTLGPERGDWAGPLYEEPFDKVGSLATYRHPLQRGSSVSFSVMRREVPLSARTAATQAASDGIDTASTAPLEIESSTLPAAIGTAQTVKSLAAGSAETLNVNE